MQVREGIHAGWDTVPTSPPVGLRPGYPQIPKSGIGWGIEFQSTNTGTDDEI